jgi:hypothetical protein
MRTLIVSTMRNEAPFLLEWLAYHQHIGFTDFLIYSNDCDDGTDAMLDRLAALGHVVHERNHSRGKKPVQWRALNKAARHALTRAADWIFVADVDEFLNIHVGDGALNDLFAAVPDADGFAIPWRMFGNSGVRAFEDSPVLAQFTHAAPETLIWPWRAVQYKSIYRMDARYAGLGVHRPKLAEAAKAGPWVDGNGAPDRSVGTTYQFSRGPRYKLAQINHYAIGSIENFLIKRDRGKPNHDTDPIDIAYWIDRNFSGVEDRSILRHGPSVAARRAALLSDPELSDLHEAAVAWRKARIAALLQEQECFQLYSALLQLAPTTPLPLDEQEAMLNQLISIRRAYRQRSAQ